jgi:hypothetical protein
MNGATIPEEAWKKVFQVKNNEEIDFDTEITQSDFAEFLNRIFKLENV